MSECEKRVWQAAFGAAWANSELMGVLLRMGAPIEFTDHLTERRKKCEQFANEAVEAYRKSIHYG